MKLWKKAALGIAGAALAGAVAFGAVFAWYYPHYLNKKTPVKIERRSAAGDVRAVSCNLRCLNPSDLGKKSWFYRADLLVKGLADAAPDVIGFQEATAEQYSYLCDVLEGYDSVMTFRDDTAYKEACPVFYRADRYELIDSGSFWLSDTPEVMSKGWDAACYRICSFVILSDRETGARFAVYNTHLDHISDTARINGINVVLEKIRESGDIPSVLMGDMNAEEDSPTYKAARESFLDAKYETQNSVSGATYQNWGAELDNNCIDYIFISQSGFEVNSFRVLSETQGGVYTSDHFPILAELHLTEQ